MSSYAPGTSDAAINQQEAAWRRQQDLMNQYAGLSTFAPWTHRRADSWGVQGSQRTGGASPGGTNQAGGPGEQGAGFPMPTEGRAFSMNLSDFTPGGSRFGQQPGPSEFSPAQQGQANTMLRAEVGGVRGGALTPRLNATATQNPALLAAVRAAAAAGNPTAAAVLGIAPGPRTPNNPAELAAVSRAFELMNAMPAGPAHVNPSLQSITQTGNPYTLAEMASLGLAGDPWGRASLSAFDPANAAGGRDAAAVGARTNERAAAMTGPYGNTIQSVLAGNTSTRSAYDTLRGQGVSQEELNRLGTLFGRRV